MFRTLVVGALIAGLALTAGCGKSAEEAQAKAAFKEATGKNAEVKMSGEQMTIKTEDGSFAMGGGKGVEIPKDFPKDVLLYKGATVTMVTNQDGNRAIILQTQDNLADVIKAYEGAMTSNGWTQEISMDMPAGKMRSFKKEAEGRAVHVNVASDGEKTVITVAVMKEEPESDQ